MPRNTTKSAVRIARELNDQNTGVRAIVDWFNGGKSCESPEENWDATALRVRAPAHLPQEIIDMFDDWYIAHIRYNRSEECVEAVVWDWT